MQLQEYRKTFFTSLSNLYPQTEIQSLFTLLISHRLNLSRVDIALNPTLTISLENETYLKKALNKLKKQIPIQYIIGETGFNGLVFTVNNKVLIPRPETEELVNWIIKDHNNKQSLKILDIGTGSGCIAVSLAKHFLNAEVTAIDISKEALKVAAKNAIQNDVKVEFLEADILKLKTLPKQFDIIVSNPPYVRELEKKLMQNNVLDNEPHLALFVADNNPLLFYNKIADFAKTHLTTNGNMYFEINQYLGNDMIQLLTNKNFKNIALRKDFYEEDRMIKATIG